MRTRTDRAPGPLRGTRPAYRTAVRRAGFAEGEPAIHVHSDGESTTDVQADGDPASSTRRERVVLPREFYAQPTLRVAEGLLGKVLVHHTRAGVAAGMIVETEAYIGEDDPACHAAPGPTLRNAPLYGPPGVAYVYLNYGVHYLVNAVTEPEGRPAAVLIRALEPLEGIALMRRRRAPTGREIDVTDLCRGPGNLTRALGITLAENRLDLTAASLTIEDHGLRVDRVSWTPRIGIRVAVERPWRCAIAHNRCVSGPRNRA